MTCAEAVYSCESPELLEVRAAAICYTHADVVHEGVFVGGVIERAIVL